MGLMPHPEHAVDPLTGFCRRRHCCSRPSAAHVDEARRHRREHVARRTASSASPTPSTRGIVERLGREPNGLELAVFSLMWSEHCAYKHSKKLLRLLPTEGPHW